MKVTMKKLACLLVFFTIVYIGCDGGTTPTGPPPKAANPSPTNGATDVSVTTNLTWTVSGGSGSYTSDIYFGTTPSPPLVSTDVTGTTYSPGTLNFDTTYYWKVTTKGDGGSTEGDVWTFTTVSSVLINEGFEGAFLPGGWKQWQKGDVGSSVWIQVGDLSHGGTKCAFHWYSDAGYDKQDWLVTATVAIPSGLGAKITFWEFGGWVTWHDYHGLYVASTVGPSVNPSTSFTEVASLGPPTEGSWGQRSFDLSTYVTNDYLTVAFVYQGDDADNWGIDDVKLEITARTSGNQTSTDTEFTVSKR